MGSRSKKKNEPEALRIDGELTIFRAAELQPLLFADPAPTRIDLSGVTEFDTAGLQLLMVAHQTAHAAQRSLQLLAPSAAVCEVLELLNVTDFFGDALMPRASGALTARP